MNVITITITMIIVLISTNLAMGALLHYGLFSKLVGKYSQERHSSNIIENLQHLFGKMNNI